MLEFSSTLPLCIANSGISPGTFRTSHGSLRNLLHIIECVAVPSRNMLSIRRYILLQTMQHSFAKNPVSSLNVSVIIRKSLYLEALLAATLHSEFSLTLYLMLRQEVLATEHSQSALIF